MTTRFFITLFALFSFYSVSAFATITIQNISGASAFDPTVKPYQLFGGTAGDSTICDGLAGTEVCNSCDGSLLACNPNRIYGNRILTFTILSDSIADNTTAMPVIRVGSGGSNLVTVGAPSTVSGKNQAATISVRWITLCQAIEASGTGTIETTNCELGALSGSLTIGFADSLGNTVSDSIEVKVRVYDPDFTLASRNEIDLCTVAVSPQQGICDFTMFPGDEKAYVTTLKPFGSFPNSGNMTIKYLRFFFSTVDFTSVTDLSSYKDIQLDTSASTGGSVSTLSDKLSDLTNDQVYFFRVANVDEAGNITDFTSDQAVIDACDGGVGPISNVDATDLGSCRFMTMPSAVLGLLPKDFNCFITSAAYGSSMEHHVQLFKKFRGEILMKNTFGRTLTRLYYKYGPYPAVFIMQNPVLKPVARAILWPAYGIAWVSLNYGVTAGLLLSLLPLLAAILIFQISRKKSHATTII